MTTWHCQLPWPEFHEQIFIFWTICRAVILEKQWDSCFNVFDTLFQCNVVWINSIKLPKGVVWNTSSLNLCHVFFLFETKTQPQLCFTWRIKTPSNESWGLAICRAVITIGRLFVCLWHFILIKCGLENFNKTGVAWNTSSLNFSHSVFLVWDKNEASIVFYVEDSNTEQWILRASNLKLH